jgi:hypothetical protein
MLLNVIKSLWPHQSVQPDDGWSLEYSTVANSFLRNHTKTSDQSPYPDLTCMHGNACVQEDDVSIITDTEEQFGKVTEMMKMAVDSNVMIFSPIEEALQAWRHCGTKLWSPLWDLMLANQLMPYMRTYSQCSTGLQELMQWELQQKEMYCLLLLGVL